MIKISFNLAKGIDKFLVFGIITLAVSNIFDAELCKGSTTDSDSVCEGSNPSSAAMASKHLGPYFSRCGSAW